MRIHRENAAITALDESHPLRRALVAHDVARDVCVGIEIEWPDAPGCAAEQEWVSAVDGRRRTFSAFAYSFISYSLILRDWIGILHPIDQKVLDYLAELRRQRRLLDECDAAARRDASERMLEMVAAARAYYDAYEAAFEWRFGGDAVRQRS
jgi:hypothetical protein